MALAWDFWQNRPALVAHPTSHASAAGAPGWHRLRNLETDDTNEKHPFDRCGFGRVDRRRNNGSRDRRQAGMASGGAAAFADLARTCRCHAGGAAVGSSRPRAGVPGMTAWQDATGIARGIAGRTLQASDVIATTLVRIDQLSPLLTAFTSLLADRARARAAAIDKAVAAGQQPGPLAGVPFAVKNLIDVAGSATLAGSKINRNDPPATADAPVISRLEAA